MSDRPDFGARPFDVLRVLDVHDGDTFKLLLDTGFDGADFPALRLKDYSCPELRVRDPLGRWIDNPEGARARMATIALMHNHIATMWVVTYKIAPDLAAKMAERYGEIRRALTRYVAEVHLDDGLLLGEELVAQGLARRGSFVG